jgi:hypothetical protein
LRAFLTTVPTAAPTTPNSGAFEEEEKKISNETKKKNVKNTNEFVKG